MLINNYFTITMWKLFLNGHCEQELCNYNSSNIKTKKRIKKIKNLWLKTASNKKIEKGILGIIK